MTTPQLQRHRRTSVRSRRRTAVAALAAVTLLALSACTGDDEKAADGELDPIPEGCVAVDMAVSPEKVTLLTDLARRFNDSDAAREGGCAVVRVQRKSSGAGMQLLSEGWPNEEVNGPKPVVWSPASSAWAAILNQKQRDNDQPDLAPASRPFMRTPLVIAMPRPMAQALGWPDTPIGYADILTLAQNPDGWGARGHPEWGTFKLGKTNPNFSTSALSATIAQYYAATQKTSELSLEDLAQPQVDAFARGVESSVVHYGDITLTFLNNLYRSDRRGASLNYVSAVAVEEKSVIDYNKGDPDGILEAGEEPRKPRVPLVAVYPKEGTLFSDNPFIVLNAPWVNTRQKQAARAFEAFITQPENQKRVVEFGFRPGNPQVKIGTPITRANGVDPNQPQNVLDVPEPPVLVRMLELWAQQRKTARVLLVVDVSGSMGEEVRSGATKLDLAKQAARSALKDFKDDDQVGLRVFTTEISRTEPTDYQDLVPIAPITQNRGAIDSTIESLIPLQGTPLYTVTEASYDTMRENYDPARINAVVLLTDGKNEDERNNDLNGLLTKLRTTNEGQAARPVRIFTIAYGDDADIGVLRRIAEATNAAAYDASDPTSINQVFTAVISNF
jgi:Ca-activated chloride channel family protein